MKTPHHLRFAKALVLSALLPACGGSGDSTTTDPSPTAATTQTTETTPTPPAETPVARDEVAPKEETADAGVDATLPLTSGPLAPPELPATFA